MCAHNQQLDVRVNIQKHITMLKPIFPKRTLISIGDYATQLLQKSKVSRKNKDILTLFIEKSKEDSTKERQPPYSTANENIVIAEKVDTHYWFDVQKYISEHDEVVEKLKYKPIDKIEGAVMVASTGEGIGSAVLADLTSRFKEGNVNSVAFAILPSELQPSDAHFNALWSMATCASKGLTQILICRDALEGYVGVDRKGVVLNGNRVLNYLIELTLAKERFVPEFSELSKSFNLKMFTVLSATGASLKVYGSLKNILDTTLLRPLGSFDLADASMLYVLVRIPLHLKDTLAREKIELIVDEWFKEKTNLKTAYVSEPIFVDDGNDRVDILMFVGGFDLTAMVTSIEKKVKDIKNYAAKNSFIEEKEWQKLIANLLK
jgi:hypothetical protein